MRGLLTLGLIGCTGPSIRPSTEVADSSGVLIATGPAIDRVLTWDFHRAFAIGGERTGPGSFTRVTRSSVASDGSGKIYAIDDVHVAVQLFDDSGRWLATLGREGQGPGELERPHSLAVTADGEVYVYDLSKRALVGYGPDGRALDQTSLELQPPPRQQRHIAGTGSGILANISVRGPPRSNLLMELHGGDTTLVASMPIPDFDMKPYSSCPGLRLRLPPVFWHFIVWDAAAGSLAYTATPEYVVTIHNESETRSVRRELAVRDAARSDALADIGDAFRLSAGPGTECVIPATEMLEVRGFERSIPWIDAVALSPEGELWVRRYEVGSAGRGPVDVFDTAGTYLGTLPATAPGLPALFLPDGRIGFIETDELDVQRLVVYGVAR